jgi:hypothetical protein
MNSTGLADWPRIKPQIGAHRFERAEIPDRPSKCGRIVEVGPRWSAAPDIPDCDCRPRCPFRAQIPIPPGSARFRARLQALICSPYVGFVRSRTLAAPIGRSTDHPGRLPPVASPSDGCAPLDPQLDTDVEMLPREVVGLDERERVFYRLTLSAHCPRWSCTSSPQRRLPVDANPNIWYMAGRVHPNI